MMIFVCACVLTRRYSAVCRRFKKVTYDANMVTRCVEAGGVTDSTRGEGDSVFRDTSNGSCYRHEKNADDKILAVWTFSVPLVARP